MTKELLACMAPTTLAAMYVDLLQQKRNGDMSPALIAAMVDIRKAAIALLGEDEFIAMVWGVA
jgi:hypothetical protein